MKNTKLWILMSFIILLFLSFLYFQSKGKTTELVQIMEVNENNILVHNMGGRVTRVYFNGEIKNITDVDAYYVVTYKYSIIQRPKLLKITFYKK